MLSTLTIIPQRRKLPFGELVRKKLTEIKAFFQTKIDG